MEHPEIDTAASAHMCQRKEIEAREILNQMDIGLNYPERGGTGKGTYWKLKDGFHKSIPARGNYERDSRIDMEAAKTRILSIRYSEKTHFSSF